MGIKRRHFLTFFGLGSVAIAGKQLINYSRQSATSAPSATAYHDPAIAAALPKTGEAPLLRFVAVADTGTGDRNQYAVAKAMMNYHRQYPYALVVLAGDNIYTNGEIEKVDAVFREPYQTLLNRGVRFRACLGNHDIRTANGELEIRSPDFNMPGRYYTFQQGSVQFFALDTNPSAPWKAQLAWLEQELTRSKASWKIVFGHHPIYSSGRYGTNAELVNTLTPLFQKHHVQLYINGHEHSYERTQAIAGTTYLITGIGGAALRPVNRSEWTAYSASRYGFTAFEVYRDRIETSAISTDNQIFDRGTVTA